MRLAVVGHVEWGEFARVERVPSAGEIVHAEESWEEVGGGGAVAAVQLVRLAGECLFLTALGDDELGRRAKRSLERLGVRVEAAWRPGPQRRAFVHTDAHAERTITVLGDRIGPRGDDPLPWDELEGADGVYLTAGDPAAARAARRARRLVATVRAAGGLAGSEVQLDALVASAEDAGERYAAGDLEPEPLLVARSEGGNGGSLTSARRQSQPLGRRAASGPSRRRLRRRRLVRGRAHLRARRRPGAGRGGGPGSPMRRRLHDRARAVRGPARWPSQPARDRRRCEAMTERRA